ncbi:MAG: DUF2191 domain-containing protein [Opitutales bacterium]|jgi:hypothetical protein
MQTTLRFADQLLRDAKAAAAQNGVSLTRFIEDSVRQRLSAAARPVHTRRRVRLPVSTAKGWLAPGYTNLKQADQALQEEEDQAWIRKHLPVQR